MTRIASRLAPLALLLIGTATVAPAQAQRSGPNAPAASALIPPSAPPRASPDQPQAAPAHPDSRTGSDDARTAPPRDHRVLGGPPVPGARQPDSSEGITTNRDVVPPRPGARPDAPSTDAGR